MASPTPEQKPSSCAWCGCIRFPCEGRIEFQDGLGRWMWFCSKAHARLYIEAILRELA